MAERIAAQGQSVVVEYGKTNYPTITGEPLTQLLWYLQATGAKRNDISIRIEAA